MSDKQFAPFSLCESLTGRAVESENEVAVTTTQGDVLHQAGVGSYDLKIEIGFEVMPPRADDGSESAARLSVALVRAQLGS